MSNARSTSTPQANSEKQPANIWNIISRATAVAGIFSAIFAGVALFHPNAAANRNEVEVSQSGDQSTTTVVQVNGDLYYGSTDSDSAESEESEGSSEWTIASIEGKTDSEILAASADLIQKGAYPTAEQLLTNFINRGISGSKMRAASYYNRGMCRFFQGNYNLAIDDFKNALAIIEFPQAFFAYGVACTMTANPDYDKAIQCYNKAIALQEAPEYFFARAAAYNSLGNLPAAHQDLQAAQEFNLPDELLQIALEQFNIA